MPTTAKFDFKKAKEQARKAMKSPLLEAIILGPSGSGKSSVLGTFGVKTLYLYGSRESHGPKAASVQGAKLIEPVAFDHGLWPGEDTPRQWTGDESWQFLTAVLSDLVYLKAEGYKAIAIDGFKVMEDIVKETTAWAEKCKSAKGVHNSFKESEASQELMGQIVSLLKTAQRELGVHIGVTAILDVKESDQYGGYVEAAPRLGGFGLAESLVQFFSDVLVVGKMTRAGETRYKFQFMTDLAKVSKDEAGNQKRSLNFNPRLTGTTPPPYMAADLAEVIRFKEEATK